MAGNPPNENLSVSGLPFDITDERVRTIFAQYGLVAQTKVLPPVPGRQDREAFVRMSSLEESKWMVENINDNILDGMTAPVVVRYSPHKGPLSPWGGLPQSILAPASVAPPAKAAPFGPGPQARSSVQILANAVANTMVQPAGGGPCTALQQQPVPIGVMLQGTVRRWDATKGFGFIGADCGGPDVFVHARELTDGEVLIPGSRVSFEAMLDVARGPGKYRAKMCLGAKPKVAMPMPGMPGMLAGMPSAGMAACAAQAAAMATGVTVPAAMPGASVTGGVPFGSGPLGGSPASVAPAPAQSVEETDRLFIQGVPLDSTEESLREVFSQYGPLTSVQKLSPAPGVSYASCLVQFQIQSQAKWLHDNVNHNIPLGLDSPVAISYAGAAVQQAATPGAEYGKAPTDAPIGTTSAPY